MFDESKKTFLTRKTSCAVHAEGNLLDRQCEPGFVFSSVGTGTKIHAGNIIYEKQIISALQLNSVTVFPFFFFLKSASFFCPTFVDIFCRRVVSIVLNKQKQELQRW